MESLERRIRKIYSDAETELTQTVNSFFARFKDADERKRKEVEDGTLTEKQYAEWRRSQIMQGEHWTRLRDEMAAKMLHANEIATSYINHELPPSYMRGYNQQGLEAERVISGYSFELIDEQTVLNLTTSDKTLLPYKSMDKRKDVRWNTKKVNSAVLNGILAGDSMPQLSRRLMEVTKMNRESAVRNARTAFNGAQNKGRLDGMKRLQDDGVILKKHWYTAMDSHTREAHAELNGVEVDIDKPFRNSIGQIMYPCDQNAAPANVYNCRCSIASVIVGFTYKPETTDTSGPFEGVPKTKQAEYKEAVKFTNPKYEVSREYKVNCSNCVVTNEARARGYDVTAGTANAQIRRFRYSLKTKKMFTGEGSWTDCFNGITYENAGATRTSNVEKSISNKLQDIDYARAAVFVEWKNGGGHYFSLEKKDGKVVYSDPQSGEVGTEYYFENCRPSSVALFRLDNLEFTDYVRKVVRWDGYQDDNP